MKGLLNEFKKFENGKICSSCTVRTVRDNIAPIILQTPLVS